MMLAGGKIEMGNAYGTGKRRRVSKADGGGRGRERKYLGPADMNDNTIRKVTPSGVVTTIGGTHGVAGAEDGPGSNALFSSPVGVAVSPAGILYVVDSKNNRISKGVPSTPSNR